MLVVVTVAAHADAPLDESKPDAQHDHARSHREVRVEPFRRNQPRRCDRHRAEQEHPCGMRKRDDRPEDERLPPRASRTHEVRGHDGLAVARAERVQDAQAERDEERREHSDKRELTLTDERREDVRRPPVCRRRRGRRGDCLGLNDRRPGGESDAAASDVERR